MKNNYKMPSRGEIIALRQRGAERQTAPWLPEEKTELEKMFYDGVELSAIAAYFKRTEPAIIMQLDAMKLYQKSRRVRTKKSGCKCPECEHYVDRKCDMGLRCENGS